MDPQQRLLLETTYEALESAGIRQGDIQKSNTAVYMATFTRDYDRNVYKDMMSIPKYHITGTGDAILANRISHLFNLHGPSTTIDTGCSGGMAAVSQACQALRSGQSDIALAGAANLILSPDHMIGMSNLHMLNKDGKSYSFDNRGAGYGRGEGIATLVIKRLDDAIRDNDPIRAILRDAAINQDGHTAGITLPSGQAQEMLGREVWHSIGLDPETVGYVEAHGTGTLAGDSAELEGISKVFCQDREASSPLIVGSIKSNIGHLECVSGLAAMIKSIMILEHGAIPPNVNFKTAKPGLNLAEKKLRIPQSLESWTVSGVPRISINNFGYGGTNAHAVLEQYSPQTQTSEAAATIPRLYNFSAANQTSLKGTLTEMKKWISSQSGDNDLNLLRDLAFTLAERRSIMSWRFSCVASSRQELVDSILKASESTDAMSRVSPDIKIALVFSGQGAQWAGMGQELMAYPAFGASIRRSNTILAELGSSWDLITELSKGKDTSRLNDAELAQPITTAVQMALVDMIQAWGVMADAVVGHSSGEVAAAYAAEYLTHHEAIKVAYFRGFSSQISKSKGLGRGGMLAVGLGEDQVAPYLGRVTQGKVVVACQNSPSSVTISGDDAGISQLVEILGVDDVFNRRLVVDTAYHSHHMQAAAQEYLASLGSMEAISIRKGKVQVYSSVTGSIKSDQFDAAYWVSNLVSKVRFCDALQALCQADGISPQGKGIQPRRIFIEIGPHSALLGPARQCIADLKDPMPYTYLSALIRGTDAIQSSSVMAGNLFSQGFPLDMKAVSAYDASYRNASVLYKLPTYSWDHSKRHWHESRLSKDYRFRKHPYHDLLGLRMTDNTPLRPVWRHMVGVEGLPWLRDHVVDGLIVFPGAGYLCMAMEAAMQLATDRNPDKQVLQLKLQHVSFLKALVIPEGRQRVEVQLAMNAIDTAQDGEQMQHNFSITAYGSDEKWGEHCRGTITLHFVSETNRQKDFPDAVLTYGQLSGQLDVNSATEIPSNHLYRELRSIGNAYGPTFSTIQKFCLGKDFATSTLTIPDIRSGMPAQHIRPHIMHPSTLDIVLHGTLPLVNQKLGAGSVMPVKIENLTISALKELPKSAGEMLSTISSLTTAHFRTAETDMVIFPGQGDSSATPVMYISGMELRSFASKGATDEDIPDGRNISYELKWGLDETFLSGASLAHACGEDLHEDWVAALTEYMKHKAFKQADLSVIQIGDGSLVDNTYAASIFLEAMSKHGNQPSFYDLADSGIDSDKHTAIPDEWAEVVNIKSIEVNTDIGKQGYEEGCYDIVFLPGLSQITTERSSTLAQCHRLLKPNGVLLMVQNLSIEYTDIQSPMLSKHGFQLQLTTDSAELGLTIARAINREQVAPPIKLQFIKSINLPLALASLTNRISNIFVSKQTHFEALPISTWSDMRMPTNDTIHVVIDDGEKPVLENAGQHTFASIVNLLQKPSKILWVTLQAQKDYNRNPMKHLVTGFARTAHAENEQLEMVTVDVQQTCTSQSMDVLATFLFEIITNFPNIDAGTREREYIYRDAGTILVPRVIPSDTLNRQITRRNTATVMQLDDFQQSQVPIKLDSRNEDGTNRMVFVEDVSHKAPLLQDHVEIDVKAYGVPYSNSSSTGNSHRGPLGEYSGVVTNVGSDVIGLKPGDRVVAWSHSSYLFANHPRLLASQVCLLPDSITWTTAATLLSMFLPAFHALLTIANIQPGQIIIIDNAAHPQGQAAVSVAKVLNARVIATVGRSEEALLLVNKFNIPSSDIISRHDPSIKYRVHRALGREGFAHVLLECGSSPPPKELLFAIKSVGTYFKLGVSSIINGQNLPQIGTVAAFDIAAVAATNPGKVKELLANTISIMSNESIIFKSIQPQTIYIGGLEDNLKAFHQNKSLERCTVLLVNEDEHDTSSIIKVARPTYTTPKLDSNATYVVAGGLGDLGQRFMVLMARAGARYFVTLSRSGASPEQQSSIQRQLQEASGLHQSKCVLLCLKCDVSDIAAVELSAKAIMSAGMPPARGLIQASIVLRDQTLDNMLWQDFHHMLGAKAFGTLNLQSVFSRGTGLDFFVALSSAVNIIGTAGQANYNATNSLQDALAQFDESDNCFYMSLNIGLIEDANVNNDVIIQSLQRQGLTPIHYDELTAYFEYALSAEARRAGCHQAVIGFTPESVVNTITVNGAVKTLMFTHVRETRELEGKDKDTAPTKMTFEEFVAQSKDGHETESFVVNRICHRLADLMQTDHGDINADEQIDKFGLDSLIAIELRNWIKRDFSAALQSSEILDSNSIRVLAQKVMQRSTFTDDDSDDGTDSTAGSDSLSLGLSTAITTRSPSREPSKQTQRSLPIPDLAETLRMFVDSRRGICPPEELPETERVVEEFLKSDGPELQEILRGNPSGPEGRLEFYENHLHLERREPLQDHALFWLGHITDGVPQHSQAERAAIVTGAALQFKERLENGTLEQNKLTDTILCMKTLEWLFHSTVEPGQFTDMARKYNSSNKVIVLRRGNLFEINIDPEDNYFSLKNIFIDILASSEGSESSIAVLTSKPRDEWAMLRTQLISIESNAATIEAIESCAFVVCLDDTSPETSSERCTSILINDRHLTNRWLDKMLQFSIAANGVSSLLAENSKLDGLSTTQLNEYITNEIQATPTISNHIKESLSTYRQLRFDISTEISGRIQQQIASNLAQYDIIGSSRRHYGALSRTFIGSKGLRSKGTVLMAILLATRMFYGHFEPAWETVTVSKYAHGRIDWLQSLTPDITKWIEAVLAWREKDCNQGALGSSEDIAQLGKELKEAVISHNQSLRLVADGRGFVEHLYALMGTALAQGRPIPALYKSDAWKYSDRHLSPKLSKLIAWDQEDTVGCKRVGF